MPIDDHQTDSSLANQETFRPRLFVDGGSEVHPKGELGAPLPDGGTSPPQQSHTIRKTSFSQPAPRTPLHQRHSSSQRSPSLASAKVRPNSLVAALRPTTGSIRAPTIVNWDDNKHSGGPCCCHQVASNGAAQKRRYTQNSFGPLRSTPSPGSVSSEEGSHISDRTSQWTIYDNPEEIDEDHDVQSQNSTLCDHHENGTTLGRSLHEEPEEFRQPEFVQSRTQRQWSPDSYEHLAMEDEIPGLVGVTTSEYQRYSRGFTCSRSYLAEYNIPPLTTSFEAAPPPEGWSTFVHPEGTRYFYRDDPNELVPVLTEAWIYDPAILDRIQTCITQISDFMRSKNINFFRPESTSPISGTGEGPRSGKTKNEFKYAQDLAPVVLVLEIRLTGRIGYYFVSHRHKSLFWLDHFDFSDMLGEVRVDYTDWLAGLQMKSHYWTHNEFFPHFYELTEDGIEEIDDILGFAIGDVLTATVNSTVNVDLETLKGAESILRRHEGKDHYKRGKSVGERRTIFRITSMFYRERFINLFGERGARLNVTQSLHYSEHRPLDPETGMVRKEKGQVSWYQRILPTIKSALPWTGKEEAADKEEDVQAAFSIDPGARKMYHDSYYLTFFSLLMFGGPGLHLRRLRDLATDQIVSSKGLKKFSEKMVEEWRDVTLYATVLLGTNVSFLSIQSVDTAGSEGRFRTNAQRASYFSILASMGTIVFSLLLLRQHREAISPSFVANRSVSRWGMESLALMYGLPFALLIWSMSSFFAAFAFMWFTAHDWVVMTSVSICCLAFAVVLTWAVLASYENGPYATYSSRAVERVKDVGRVVRSATRRMSEMTIGGLPPFRKNSTVQMDDAESGSGPGLELDPVTPSKEDVVTTSPQTPEFKRSVWRHIWPWLGKREEGLATVRGSEAPSPVSFNEAVVGRSSAGTLFSTMDKS